MKEENIEGSLISQIEIRGIWDNIDIKWKLYPDVNILAGINGSGKTTLLNILEELLQYKVLRTKNQFKSAEVSFKNGTIVSYERDFLLRTPEGKFTTFTPPSKFYEFSKISTFDTPRKNPKNSSKLTQLDIELREIINGDGSEKLNFIKLDAINSDKEKELLRADKKEAAAKIQQEQPDFFKLINTFFAKTGKIIELSPGKNIFFETKDGTLITHDKLSAGEKQLLILLFSVYLQQQKPTIMLLDEPEISLHIEWQSKLIDTLRAINPNCQLIIATHSPSIFGKGWGDKFVDMKTITS